MKTLYIKGLLIFVCSALFLSSAFAEIVAIGRMPVGNGNVKVTLFNDPPLIPECRGVNLGGALVELEKNGVETFYGSGCWAINDDGYIHLFIKSLDDGIVRDSKIHQSKFSFKNNSTESLNSNSRTECKELYQAWIFNRMLEELCDLNLGVARKIGEAAKNICSKINDKQRDLFGVEVFKSVKEDLDSIGSKEFCRRNRAGYLELAK